MLWKVALNDGWNKISYIFNFPVTHKKKTGEAGNVRFYENNNFVALKAIPAMLRAPSPILHAILRIYVGRIVRIMLVHDDVLLIMFARSLRWTRKIIKYDSPKDVTQGVCLREYR